MPCQHQVLECRAFDDPLARYVSRENIIHCSYRYLVVKVGSLFRLMFIIGADIAITLSRCMCVSSLCMWMDGWVCTLAR